MDLLSPGIFEASGSVMNQPFFELVHQCRTAFDWKLRYHASLLCAPFRTNANDAVESALRSEGLSKQKTLALTVRGVPAHVPQYKTLPCGCGSRTLQNDF